MSEEQVPDIEEIKERIEIPVEEDDIEGLKAEEKSNGPDVMDEFKNLGRQFAETIESFWNSEERVRVETELREGVHSFVDEVDKVIREAKGNETVDKMKGDAAEAKANFENSDLGGKTRDGIVQGLTWISEEFGKLAEQFAPSEKAPEDVAEEVLEEEPVVEKSPESE
jgi:hypothetical protein